MLNHTDKIGVISCNSCARECGVGGLHNADELVERLIAERYTVTDEIVLQYACSEPIYQRARLKLEADTLIVLSCSAGLKCVQRLFPDKKGIPVTIDGGLFITETEKEIVKILYPFPGFEKGEEFSLSTGHPLSKRHLRMEDTT
jgi:hypothetical protein